MAKTGTRRDPANSAASSLPQLAYRPAELAGDRPGIGLIGCGEITVEHLTAYRAAGYPVLALCDIQKERAQRRQQEFFPGADIYTNHHQLLARDDIRVVDIATHPPIRPALITDALQAGKHVLSQKPFVLDLDEGRRLANLADTQGVQLAVNQNARWAPHFGYLRSAVEAGLLGQLTNIHCAVHWDHNWVAGTEFDNVRHLILYDFAIHWFDLLTCWMGDARPTRVYASTARGPAQQARPNLLGQAAIEYEAAQATLVFGGAVEHGPHDYTYLAGTHGSALSEGPSLKEQQVTLECTAGTAKPRLQGTWFPDGFHGAMAELLSAIEQGRTPTNNARDNLRSLALCFAAAASADRGQPMAPGEVTQMPV